MAASLRPRQRPVILRLALVAAATAYLAACASTGSVPRPFPMPGGTRGAPGPPARTEPGVRPPVGGTSGYAIAGSALAFRGVHYRNGGADPSGFDCSGLVQYVFAQQGIALPRQVRDLYHEGDKVDRNELEPGDLVFFTTVSPGASHVGIALGGDQFVHAPSSSGVVRVEHLSASYWSRRFVGARRIEAGS